MRLTNFVFTNSADQNQVVVSLVLPSRKNICVLVGAVPEWLDDPCVESLAIYRVFQISLLTI